MERTISPLERARLGYRPVLPDALAHGASQVTLTEGEPTTARADPEAISAAFPDLFGAPTVKFSVGSGAADARPQRVGVVLSGGQAPGGHNVICGLFDALKAGHADSELFGFLGGPRGIIEDRSRVLSQAEIDAHRNTGGFDLIGSGRDKIETPEQLTACRESCERHRLDGLVVIGGDDSNTNAAVLAQQFIREGCSTVVVGVPKTIDGDLKGGGVEASFGFDTATRVYSELIGNIERDARSAKKYWHFIKLMGRSASHVTLECALATRPNVALIGEEVARQRWTLAEVSDQIAAVVRERAAAGKAYGVCLVPEGLIEFVPEIGVLIAELNELIGKEEGFDARPIDEKRDAVRAKLSTTSLAVFHELPGTIQSQLLIDRDSHGNVQVSRIDTEALLIETVRRRLPAEHRFQTQHHFFGYEGRCAAPSNFDANYTAALGRVAALLIAHRRTGYLCAVGDLALAPDRWSGSGIPLSSLMQLETRKGNPTPVIAKALVDLDGAPFAEYARCRDRWRLDDAYVYPGPIQYFGPAEVADQSTQTLQLEAGAG